MNYVSSRFYARGHGGVLYRRTNSLPKFGGKNEKSSQIFTGRGHAGRKVPEGDEVLFAGGNEKKGNRCRCILVVGHHRGRGNCNNKVMIRGARGDRHTDLQIDERFVANDIGTGRSEISRPMRINFAVEAQFLELAVCQVARAP